MKHFIISLFFISTLLSIDSHCAAAAKPTAAPQSYATTVKELLSKDIPTTIAQGPGAIAELDHYLEAFYDAYSAIPSDDAHLISAHRLKLHCALTGEQKKQLDEDRKKFEEIIKKLIATNSIGVSSSGSSAAAAANATANKSTQS